MKIIKSANEFNNIPPYCSSRVTVDTEYDTRDKRYLTHKRVLFLDNQPICYQEWTEDDDWGSYSNSFNVTINEASMYDSWLNAR